jgi:uncharacterized OB-fold protein
MAYVSSIARHDLLSDVARGSMLAPCAICACGIRDMLADGWTVVAKRCNVGSRSQHGPHGLTSKGTFKGGLAEMAEAARAKPKPTPETQHFWDGTQAGELRLQRCDACANIYFPPRPFCPSCASRKVSVFKASGKGKLYSYIIHHRPAPGFTPPYSIAVVELEEGPRMMTNIIDCPQTPEALELDMTVEVAFEKLDDKITLPLFRPAKG